MARTHDPPQGSRIRNVPSLGPRTGTIARQAQTRGLPRLPLRVERPKDVFNPSVLNMRLVQGVASYLTSYQQTVCLRRHPIDLKKRHATLSDLGGGCASPTATSLKLTPMGSCRIRLRSLSAPRVLHGANRYGPRKRGSAPQIR